MTTNAKIYEHWDFIISYGFLRGKNTTDDDRAKAKHLEIAVRLREELVRFMRGNNRKDKRRKKFQAGSATK